MMDQSLRTLIEKFLFKEGLPDSFEQTVETYYLPCLKHLKAKAVSKPLVLGVNGAQGSGKSTFASCIALLAKQRLGWNVAVLSIDDLYYTKAQRKTLAAHVHPLLKTRGVPGTHDVELGLLTLSKLKRLEEGESVKLPRFDKATDDRYDMRRWPTVSGPVDLVVLEGWCVGSMAQTKDQLVSPVNTLEESEDADGVWRQYVNHQLEKRYPLLWQWIDQLIMLKVPSFDCVTRWRGEQEEKLLASRTATGEDISGVMDKQQLERFIQHYQRITEYNLAALSKRADIVYELDESHQIVNVGHKKC